MTVTSKPDATHDVPMITATIDGIEVTVPKGTLIIRAAEQIGIEIPRFCDHPLLDKVAACRQCLVEVAMPGPDGTLRTMTMPGSSNIKPQPACAIELTEGMEVKTQVTSPGAQKAQEGVMEFLLLNHPLDCPICDKGGECPLQNQAMSDGRGTSRFIDTKRTFPKPIRISTQVLLDRERCIVCQRCTRFTKQIAGDAFIDLQMRGARQQIGTFSPGVLGIATQGEQMLDESGVPFASYFSGNTIQICPVGALTSASYRFRSRPFDLVSSPGVCDQCSSGCAIRSDHRRGVILRRLAMNDPQVNEEWNCDKGRFAFKWFTGTDRITTPLVRGENGELEPASWPYALQVAAQGLAAARDGVALPSEADVDSADAAGERAAGVGVLPGGALPVEDAYAYAKFARVALGTHDVDHRSRACGAEEEQFLASLVAGTGVRVSYQDLEAAPAVLLVALEPEEESPMVFLRLRKARHAGTNRVFAVTSWAGRGLTKLDATVLPAAPGTEPDVLAAVRDGQEQPFAAALDAIRAPGAVILVGERAAVVPGLLSCVAELARETGAGLAWVPRRAGERGAVDAGTLPSLLPGGRPLTLAAARAEVEQFWGSEVPAQPGRDLPAILDAARAGALGGLLVGGMDPDDLPDPAAAREALAAVPFLVSLEVRHSAVTELADVVFPVAPVAERTGTYVDWEGRYRPFKAALRTDAMTDAKVLHILAGQLGVDLGLPEGPVSAAAELGRLGRWDGERPPAPAQAPAPAVAPAIGQAVLATWHLLLDKGRGQDGEPFLAGTAHRAVARLSAGTAAALQLPQRDAVVTLSTDRGSITLPALRTPMPDHVVWVPTNSAGSQVYAALGAGAGDHVKISVGQSPVAEGSHS